MLGIALYHFASYQYKDVNVADLGLGRNTASANGFLDGHVLNCSGFHCPDGLRQTHRHFDSLGQSVAILLGNSQLHAINLIKPTDKLAVQLLDEALKANQINIRTIQYSIPHANFHEHLANYLKARAEGKSPAYVIIGAVYYDLHTRKMMVEDTQSISQELASIGGQGLRQLSDLLDERKKTEAATARNAVEQDLAATPQEKLEKLTVAFLEEHWQAYARRSVLAALPEHLMNEFFTTHIRSHFKRRSPEIPNDIKEWNLRALESLIQIARRDGAQVILYIPPIRPHFETYLNAEHYRDFQSRLQSLANQYHVHFRNFENLVPEQYWGFANGGLPDYFHFQGEGHSLLSKALFETLNSLSKEKDFSKHAIQ